MMVPVNFKIGKEIRSDVINMSRARDKETYDHQYTGLMLYPLSYEGLMASWVLYKFHA